MIKIAFEAPNRAALIALILDFAGALQPAAADVKPPKADKPAAAPKAEPPAAPAAAPAAPAATAPTAVTYDDIAAAVPKASALGPVAAGKVRALMTEWGVAPPKKVKDVVPVEKYGEFLAAVQAITNG